MKRTIFLLLTFFACLNLSAQYTSKVELWNGFNKKGETKNNYTKAVRRATSKIYVYPATQPLVQHTATQQTATTPAVIICPGGSYHHLGMKHEGHQVAQWFQEQGITAFVLRYRVSSHRFHHPAMIEDIQYTIYTIRKNALKMNIDTTKIGAIGFSAGGHLVLHAGATHTNYLQKDLLIDSENIGVRPNCVMAIYPVVSMEDSIAHVRSRKNLLTQKYTKTDIQQFSIEQNIPTDMPPIFLLAAEDDDVVDFRNSEVLDKALTKANISHEFMHLKHGGHGFGMFRTTTEESKNWNEQLYKWLEKNEMLPKSSYNFSTSK